MWDRERLAELESYEQIETDENIARGMSPAEARAAARRKLGNTTLIREEIYQMNPMAIFDRLPARRAASADPVSAMRTESDAASGGHGRLQNGFLIRWT